MSVGDVGASWGICAAGVTSCGVREAGGDCKKDGMKIDCNDRRSFTMSMSRNDSSNESAWIPRAKTGLASAGVEYAGDVVAGVVTSECERVDAYCDSGE
jgi:hypothetical protein